MMGSDESKETIQDASCGVWRLSFFGRDDIITAELRLEERMVILGDTLWNEFVISQLSKW
jgi:hypothetical protein